MFDPRDSLSDCSRFWRLLLLLCATLLLLGAGEATSRPDGASDRSYRQYAPGLLVRTSYVAPDSGSHHVELWDLLVGPGMSTESLKLPGAVVFEVRSGAGRLRVDSDTRAIETGQTLSVAEGQAIAIDNAGATRPLVIRATLVSGRRE